MPNSLLAGLRVVDLGELASAPYCAKLLADAGADVVHVERPEGDPSRACGPFAPDDREQQLSALFAFLNAGKRGVTLDWREPHGAALLWRLVEWADLLVENVPPGELEQHGFSTDALLARNPALVRVSISPYGRTGPYREFAATELTLQAMAGMMDGNGLEEREPIRYPGFVAQHMAGANAAYAGLVAYRHARRTGVGQQVDVSVQETAAATYYALYASYEYLGTVQQRGQQDLYRTADGRMMLGWRTSIPWDVFALAFDALELTLDPALQPPLGFMQNRARVEEVLARSLATKPSRHWFAQAREHRIAAGMLQSLDEVQACPQLAARGFFDTLPTPSGAVVPFPGEPYWVDGGRSATLRRPPALGEQNALLDGLPARARTPLDGRATAGAALAGVRVIDNGIVEAGTFPTRCLADFGAEVVRVENYPVPDVSRSSVLREGGPDEPYWEQSGTYHEQHRNKDRCIGLDLRLPEGRDAFLRLCMASDVMVDSHPPDVMEKLGLGPRALLALKPDLVVVTTSGYGYGGPYTPVRSYGMFTELMCGLSSLNGYPGGEPRRGMIPITDNMSVFHIAFLIMAALEQRDRTGKGAWIDVSQYEAGINVTGDLHLAHALGVDVPAQQANADPPSPFSGCYPCLGEDEWITLSAQDPSAWRSLCALVGMPALEGTLDPWRDEPPSEMRDRLDGAIRAWTAARTPARCLAELQARGVAAGAVYSVRELLLDPHLEERGYFWLVDHHPVQQTGRRAWPGASARLTRTPGCLKRPAPMLGEHNAAVLCDLLGSSPSEYERMIASGAAGTVPLATGMRPAGLTGFRMRAPDTDAIGRLRRRFGSEFGVAPAIESLISP